MGGEALKRIIAILIILVFLITVAGCGRDKTVTLLSNDVCTVTRTGREICVCDVSTGAECRYKIMRTTRSTSAAARENRVGNLTVVSGRGVMVIYGSGTTWIVRL